MVKIANVYKSYITKHNKTEVLKDVSFTVEDGEFLSIMGPSGCGKSTLLNILGCMDCFDAGTYEFDGANMSKLSEKELSLFRNKNIGFIFQSFHLIQKFTTIENVEFPMGVAKRKINDIKVRAKELLESVGLGDKFKNKSYELSGGQQQRVAIARALANKPKLLLADEPTGNLDEESGRQVMSILKRLNSEENVTIIMVTHDEKCASYSDRIIRMVDGKIV